MDDLLTIVEKNNNLPNVTLDFDALRTEGTAYIAQLGHRLWTDFNVHDPGITMLEVLCFAINDLAFRSNFPMQDLLAEREPQNAKKQFYTAAEILSCCPVTPLDFRKLIIDVEGVKNAWVFKSGAEGNNFYWHYFLQKTHDEITKILGYVNSLNGYLRTNPTFPITRSCCDFLEEMDKSKLKYGDFGPLLCQLLTYEAKVFAIRQDLEQIKFIINLLVINEDDIEKMEVETKTPITPKGLKQFIVEKLAKDAKQYEDQIADIVDITFDDGKRLLNNVQFREINDFLQRLTDQQISFIETISETTNPKLVILEEEMQRFFKKDGVSDKSIQTIIITLVTEPAINAFLIREDPIVLLDRLQQFYQYFPGDENDIKKLINETFAPTDALTTVKEKIRMVFLKKYPNDIDGVSRFLNAVEPFLWVFPCRFNGPNVIYDLIYNLDRFLRTLKNLIPKSEVTSFKNIILEGAILYELIKTHGLENHVDEVLRMLDCFALPGRALRNSSERTMIEGYLSNLSKQNLITLDDFNEEALYKKITNTPDENKLDALAEFFCKFFVGTRIVFRDPDDINVSLSPVPVALNGLYNICLDLENRIDPDDILAVNEIKAAVRKRLSAYRNLDEDFCAIDVVGVKPICVEANIAAADNADVNEVMAKIIYRIQEFLSTGPQFNSLREMLDRGLSCDEIFQGPLLEQGFLDDEEVEQARLRRVIYKSDLYQQIIDVEGVVAISCLKIQLCRTSDRVCAYENEWCLDICQKEQSEADGKFLQTIKDPSQVGKYATSITCKYKPLLNIQSSNICFQKGGMVIPTDPQEVAEKLELMESLNRRPAVGGERDIAVPAGNYRDLDRYQSIQEDFPLVYRIGKGQISSSFPNERKAQVKQMKAYLTFFDQLLANYLAQLGKLKDNLSVNADPNDPVLASRSMLGLDPSIDELFFQMYQVNEGNIQKLSDPFPDHLLTKLDVMKSLPPMHREPFLRAAKEIFSMEEIEKPVQEGEGPDQQAENSAQKGEKAATKNEDEKVITALLTHAILPDYYANQLSQMVENDLERHQRRNKILDHLIARFGERFTDYALSLYSSSPDDPCKAAKINIKDDLLHCKTEFLKSIPLIGSHRGKGFDYMDKDCCTQEELFWKTDNVPGMQKRVNRLLCLKHTGRVQLSCQPKVTVEKDIDVDNSFYSYVVVDADREPNDPRRTVYLRGTKEYTLRGKGKRELDKIREALLNANNEIKVPGVDKRQLFVDGTGPFYLKLRDADANIVAESQPLNAKEAADDLRDQMMGRIFSDDCDTEGFHVIEHVLLRPIAKAVPSLAPIDLCGCKVSDPYSFWISVIALDNWKRFSAENGGRAFFEQTVRRETPAHLGICFLWLSGEQMFRFEKAYKNWLYDLSRLGADDCQIEESLTGLVAIMNELLVRKCPDPCLKEQVVCCP